MWNSLKSLVLTDEALAAEKVATSAAVATTKLAAPSPTGAQPVSPTAVSPEFVAAIRKVVFSRNTALTQILGAAEKLVDIIPDPTTRLKAAFKMAADGRTVQQIAAAVDIHVADVESEEARFKQAIDKKIAEEVGGQERRAAAATSGIQANNTQIEQLQNRIAELGAQINTFQQDYAQATSEAASKRAEIEQAQFQFKAAAELVRGELQSQKSAILSALS
jgi:hypothetical protein